MLYGPEYYEKLAGGEILGGLARLAARPFIGAERSNALGQKVVGGITKNLNQPIEAGLRRAGVHKAISKGFEVGMTPIPGTPRLVHPVMPMVEQRRAYGNWKADDAVKTISENPEIAAALASPVPGTTATYLGGKALLGKALGMKKQAQVQPYQQETQWSCSAACLKAVLAHYGVEVPETLAIQAIGTREGRGAEVDEIPMGARKLGFEAFDYEFESLAQAKFLLDHDIPIIADVQSFNYPGKGHYVIIGAMDETHVFLMDPNTPGNTRTLTWEEMDNQWWDARMANGERVNKWGAVVLPPEGANAAF